MGNESDVKGGSNTETERDSYGDRKTDKTVNKMVEEMDRNTNGQRGDETDKETRGG